MTAKHRFTHHFGTGKITAAALTLGMTLCTGAAAQQSGPPQPCQDVFRLAASEACSFPVEWGVRWQGQTN